MKITERDRNSIKEAIKHAELSTTGEIVPVIVDDSTTYRVAHFKLAMAFGIVGPIAGLSLSAFTHDSFLVAAQISGLALGYALAYIPSIKRALTPKSRMAQAVRRKAIEYFYEHEVSKTRDRTGIMIFISLFERRVEIISDHAIYEQFGKDYWSNLENVLADKTKTGDFVSGIKFAIGECGKSLNEYFPIKEDDENELDDNLISE